MDGRRFKVVSIEFWQWLNASIRYGLSKQLKPKLAANLADNCRELNQSFNKTMYISRLMKWKGGFVLQTFVT